MEQEIHNLQLLAEQGPPWAAERARIALSMLSDRQSGALSEEEFAELMQDLVRADRLDEEADDLETKTMLITAVYVCANIM